MPYNLHILVILLCLNIQCNLCQNINDTDMTNIYKKTSQLPITTTRRGTMVPTQSNDDNDKFDLGDICEYKGVATPDMDPGVPDGNCYWDTSTIGVYTNFDGVEVKTNDPHKISYKDEQYSIEKIDIKADNIKAISSTTASSKEYYTRLNGLSSNAKLDNAMELSTIGDYIEFYARQYKTAGTYDNLGLFGDSITSKNILGFVGNQLWIRESNGDWVKFSTYINGFDEFRKIRVEIVSNGWQLSVDDIIIQTISRSSNLYIDRIGNAYNMNSCYIDLKTIDIYTSSDDTTSLKCLALEDISKSDMDLKRLEESELISYDIYYKFNPIGYNNAGELWVYTRIGQTDQFIATRLINWINDSEMHYVDIWRIKYAIVAKLTDGTMVHDNDKYLLTEGDSEGVYQRRGKADFTGGAHGDEKKYSVVFFADSIKLSLLYDIPLTGCEDFEMQQSSKTYETSSDGLTPTTHTPEFKRFKKLTFCRNKIHVYNNWEALQNIPDIMLGYFSLVCISHYVSNKVIDPTGAGLVFNEDATRKYQSTFSELTYWNDVNNTLAKVSSHFSINNDSATQEVWDAASYHKYYRNICVDGDFSINSGERLEAEHTIEFRL